MLKPLHAIILVCLLIFGGLYYYADRQEERYRDSASLYLQNALHDISRWEAEAIWPLLAEPAKAVVTREQLNAVMSEHRRLGRFLRMEKPQFSKLTSAMSVFTDETRVGYSFPAYFENGKAMVNTSLVVKEGEHFEIYNFNIKPSPELAE